MSTDDASRLAAIALRVADGARVDWEDEIRRCRGDDLRRRILALRAIESARGHLAAPPVSPRRGWILLAAVMVLLLTL